MAACSMQLPLNSLLSTIEPLDAIHTCIACCIAVTAETYLPVLANRCMRATTVPALLAPCCTRTLLRQPCLRAGMTGLSFSRLVTPKNLCHNMCAGLGNGHVGFCHTEVLYQTLPGRKDVEFFHQGIMRGADDPKGISLMLWACASLGYAPSAAMLVDFKVTPLHCTSHAC